MRKKMPPFSKLAFSIFLAIFALCFISLDGSNGFLKPSIADAADPAVGLTKDNPGIRTAIEAQGRNSEKLMTISGIVGHGIGISSDGTPVIKIFATRAGIPNIPSTLDNVPTKVEVTGMVVAYADPTLRFDRPVPIGVSTGHPEITAGTIGCRVTDGTNVYALSNNHVYANQNDASYGDSALQPGPYDGGQDSEDAIGTLYDFEIIDFSGAENTLDAAIALSSTTDLGTSTPGVPGSDGYGTPSSTIEDAHLDEMRIQKYGRTTGWTEGVVDTINTLVDVCYETRGPFRCVKLARFVEQISITPGTFSAGGDSGSLIVTEAGNNPVALLFAGSNTHTFANPIGLVLEHFGVTVDSGGPIEPLTDIAVTDVSTPGSVVMGDQVDVNVTVQNTGNQDVVDSFDVVLTDSIDELNIDPQTVSTLAAGSSIDLIFRWDTSTASLGEHTLEGSHDLADDDVSNDSSTAVVLIEEALTDIAVTDISAPGSVVVGDQVDVNVTVQNIGNQDVVDSFNVVLTDSIDELNIDPQTVSTLAAGSSTTLIFQWDTSTASLGDHTLEGSHDLADDDASNDSSTSVVTVNEADAIALIATGKQNKNWLIIDLDWSGATSDNVDIYRDGAIIVTTSNDGAYTDKISNPGGVVSLTYQVCEAGSSSCSNEAIVTF